MRRPHSLLLLLGFVFGLTAPTTAASAQSVQWDATLGFEGVYKEGAWTPVFVDISNQGDSESGEIRLPITEYVGTFERELISYSLPVDIPRNSNKRHVLYIASERPGKIYLRVGRKQSEKELSAEHYAAPDDTLVVILGGDRGLLRFLTGTPAVPPSEFRSDTDQRPGYGTPAGDETSVFQVGHADWDALPDSWIGWDGVNAVILGDAGFAGASQQDLDALLTWVQLGGTLVVPGGAQAPQMAASLVGGFLPTDVRGTATAPHLGALETWTGHAIDRQPALVADGPTHAGASVLCGSRQHPLVAVRQVGSGRIAMTSFDFTAAPVKYWDGQAAMWQRLLSQAPCPPSLTVRAEAQSPWGPPQLTLSGAATYTPAAALPPFWLLLGFLGAYIIVLVPVNYALLNRIDRRELAWLTTPAIVIIFTVGAYIAGYGLRGGNIILNRLAVIEAAADTGIARGRGYVGIFSPKRTSYELALEHTAIGARDLTIRQERTRSAARVSYGEPGVVSNIAMNMWTSRAFGVDFLADLQGGVGGYIEWDGSALTAYVENNTGLTLRECRVVRGNVQGSKRNLRPGQAATWAFGKRSSIGERSWNRFRRHLIPPEEKEGMAEIAARSLFGDTPHMPPGAFWRDVTGPRVLALLDAPLTPVKLNRRGVKTNDLALLIVDLPLRITPGPGIPIPGWIIRRRIISTDGSVGRGDPWHPQLAIYEGSAVLEFQVPLSEKGREALGLTLSLSAGPAPGQAGPGGLPTLAAYNFQRNSWEPLPGAVQSIKFRNPAAYMSSDGRVLVEIEAPPGGVSVNQAQLFAEVNAY